MVILVVSFISFLIVIPHIFISWRKGPKWWVTISPFVYFAMLLLSYIIMPSIIVIYTVVLILAPTQFYTDYYSSWNIMYCTIACCQFVSFFVVIKKTIMSQIKIYKDIKEKKRKAEEIPPLTEKKVPASLKRLVEAL